METTTIDGIARTLGNGITRRGALRGLFAGAMAAVAGGALLQADDASARRRRKKNRKSNKQSAAKRRKPGAFCDSSSQCQTDRGYICDVAVNAGNSDKTCSGASGAVCGPQNGDGDDTAPFCAVGHECVAGVCRPVSEEF